MKVLIRSVGAADASIRAACEAVATLRHHPIVPEDVGARPDSPVRDCMRAVTDADVIMMLFGNDAASTESPTPAVAQRPCAVEGPRRGRPVLAFIQAGPRAELGAVDFSPDDAELQGAFTGPEDLHAAVVRALHDYEVLWAGGEVVNEEITQQALAMLPRVQRKRSPAMSSLFLAIVAGTTYRTLDVLKPVDEGLNAWLLREALHGESCIFDPEVRAVSKVKAGGTGSTLVLTQAGSTIVVFPGSLNEPWSMLLKLPIPCPHAIRRSPHLLASVVRDSIATGLKYGAAALERCDPTQRRTDVAFAGRVSGRAVLGGAVGPTREERPAVVVRRCRPALRVDLEGIAGDLFDELGGSRSSAAGR